MATQNVLTLPRMISSAKNCLAAVRKDWSGGNNVFRPPITKFLDGTAAAKIFGCRTLPKSLDNGQTTKAVAIVSLDTDGDTDEGIRLTFAYSSQAANESADIAAATESVPLTVDVSAWSAKVYKFVEFTLTASNLTGGEFFEYSLERDPTHTDDDFEAAVYLHELHLLCYY